jgi:2-polyprenyl-3-methyl-5-hydroxy-6-metoxy-1,4-benzoquinol methylase
MNKHITCLLCTIAGPAEVVSAVLRDDASGCFQVVRCLTCGHVQLFPLPSPEEDAAYYQTDSQTRTLMGSADLAVWQSKSTDDTTRRVKWVQSLLAPEKGKILDIGCGYGIFVDALVQAGYQAIGLDISQERLALAKENLRGEFIQGEVDDSLTETYSKSFQVVTLFHTLEHLRTPVTFLQQCFELVASEGYLLVEIPNLGDELLEHQAEYRAFFWQRAHLSYFDAAHLELALRRAGFQYFSIRGVQRYGLRNLLHWLEEGKPQLFSPAFRATEPMLVRMEQLYRAERERALNCDTLIAEVHK